MQPSYVVHPYVLNGSNRVHCSRMLACECCACMHALSFSSMFELLLLARHSRDFKEGFRRMRSRVACCEQSKWGILYTKTLEHVHMCGQTLRQFEND